MSSPRIRTAVVIVLRGLNLYHRYGIATFISVIVPLGPLGIPVNQCVLLPLAMLGHHVLLPLGRGIDQNNHSQGLLVQVHGKNGLLLIKYKDIDRPRRFCGLSIDFGSTHTRAFRIECEANGEARANAEVEVLRMASGVHDLTRTDPGQIAYYFFSWESHDELFDAEINSQMLIPYPNHDNPPHCLPREGHAFRHSIYHGFPPMDLRFNLKWNTSIDNS